MDVGKSLDGRQRPHKAVASFGKLWPRWDGRGIVSRAVASSERRHGHQGVDMGVRTSLWASERRRGCPDVTVALGRPRGHC